MGRDSITKAAQDRQDEPEQNEQDTDGDDDDGEIVRFTTRIPKDLNDDLEDFADDDERSKNSAVLVLLKNGLKRHGFR